MQRKPYSPEFKEQALATARNRGISPLLAFALYLLLSLMSPHILASCNAIYADSFESSGVGLFQVTEAIAISPREVHVCFNETVNATTVNADGRQFVFDRGLIATSSIGAGTRVKVRT